MELNFKYPATEQANDVSMTMSELLHFEILDGRRRNILPKLAIFKNLFYLADSTGLELQLGHRDSIDFDYFQERPFIPYNFAGELLKIFDNCQVTIIQKEIDTLTVMIDNSIKLSFSYYSYQSIKPIVNSEFFNLASVEDIGRMKLSAITGRTLLKDYVDLYFILKIVPLKTLLSTSSIKFPNLDTNLILKSLVCFDDIIDESILFKNNQAVTKEEVKRFFENQVEDIGH